MSLTEIKREIDERVPKRLIKMGTGNFSQVEKLPVTISLTLNLPLALPFEIL